MSTLSQFPKTVKTWATTYQALVLNKYKKGKDFREGIFEIKSTTNLEDRDVELGGIGGFEEWVDGQPAVTHQIQESFQITYRQKVWGMQVPFGRMMRQFSTLGEAKTAQLSTQMGYKAYKLEQETAFSLFKNGFATTVPNGYGDGKPTFSTLHPLSSSDSTTWSNALANSGVVGEAALLSMMTLLDETPTPTGEDAHYGEMGYIWIVTNMDDYYKAIRLVSPDANERPGTTNREINVVAGELRGVSGRPIEVRFVPWAANATYPNAHYLVAKGEAQMKVLNNEAFYMDVWKDEATDTIYNRGRMSFSYGLTSPRGVVGSIGDGSTTYSS